MNSLVRPATSLDLPAVSQLAGDLVRLHHGFDPKRFMMVPGLEAGYAHFFQSELANPDAIILVGELDGEVVGYTYGRLEPRDWNQLADAHGAIHDIYVDSQARRKGLARFLVTELLAILASKGAPRVLLHTATQNIAARRLFTSLGFRQTMLEMTRES